MGKRTVANRANGRGRGSRIRGISSIVWIRGLTALWKYLPGRNVKKRIPHRGGLYTRSKT